MIVMLRLRRIAKKEIAHPLPTRLPLNAAPEAGARRGAGWSTSAPLRSAPRLSPSRSSSTQARPRRGSASSRVWTFGRPASLRARPRTRVPEPQAWNSLRRRRSYRGRGLGRQGIGPFRQQGLVPRRSAPVASRPRLGSSDDDLKNIGFKRN